MKKLLNFGKPYTMGLLKELLLGLIMLFGLIGFSNANDYYTAGGDINIYSNGNYNFTPGFCANSTTIFGDLTFYYSDGTLLVNGSDIPTNNYVCFYVSGYVHNNRASVRVLKGFNIYDFGFSCPVCEECEICPEVDTGAILSGYIAIDDITDNYCISNGLCGEISTGLSTLYINDIRHESKPFLYVNIPEEFDWEYTGNVAQMFIDIKGYNTDSDYIAGIINTQISKPTSEDFGNLINVVSKFVPGLVIILFIYFIFRFIKKIF